MGDSRAYLLRGGEMLQLTHDHVVNHPDFKHQLLRSVGAEDHVVVDYLQGELLVGDVFVLVTNSASALEVFGQLYRDRADCENGFDELKNQWGWGRLHDSGHRTLPDERQSGGARLQLVELVLPGGQAGRPDGGNHEPRAAARRGRPDGQACRADHAALDADARGY